MLQYSKIILICIVFLSVIKSENIQKVENITINNVIEHQTYEIIPIITRTFPSDKKLEFFGVSKYKLGVCLIGKNFSSIMVRILCSLLKGKSHLHKFNFDECDRSRRYISATALSKANNMTDNEKLFKKWRMLMIIRNPIDRLISGFMQLCYYNIWLTKEEDYCYGCGKNITCFVDKLHDELLMVSSEKKIPNQFHDYHFYPQTWQCEYFNYKKKYNYLKYPTNDKKVFYNEVMRQLKKSGVPQKHISYLSDKVRSFTTFHKTVNRKETKEYKKSLYKNSKLLQKICSIFYYDFIELNFKFPGACKNFKITPNNTISY